MKADTSPPWRSEPASALAESVRVPLKQMHEGYLILVNRDYPVRTEEMKLAPLPSGMIQAFNAEEPTRSLESECGRQLAALLAACRGLDSIAVVSGYRSKQAQQNLYDNSIRENGIAFTESYVARPGASEHQTGLAVDVGLASDGMDYIRPSFPTDGACGRFKRLAADYGFIERYKESKSSLTGIAGEPWHYRYVGFPHAAIMERENMCLEEYAGFIRQFAGGDNHLAFGNRFEIYYAAAAGELTSVPIPAARQGSWRISGDNCNGFVVTVTYPGGKRHGG